MKLYYLKRIHPTEKAIIPFKKNEILVGRGKDCTYFIPDESISRSHALFKRSGDVWTLKNLSTNKLSVDKTMIKQHEDILLKVGNIIHVGHSDEYCFRFGMKEKKLNKRNEEEDKCSKTNCEEKSVLTEQQCILEEKLLATNALHCTLLKEKDGLISSMKEEKDTLQQRFIEEQAELERKLSEGILAHQSVVEEKVAMAERLNIQMEEIQKRHEEEKYRMEKNLRKEEEIKVAILKEKEELSMKLQLEKENMEKQLLQERKKLEDILTSEREKVKSQFSVFEEHRIRLEREVQNREYFLKMKEEEQENLKKERLKEASILKEDKERLLQRLREVEADLEEKSLLTSTLAGELQLKEEVDHRLEAVMKDKQNLEQKLQKAIEKGTLITDLQDSLRLLEAQKLSLEQEVASVATISETARKEALETVSDVVENEFQCPVCNELFITAIMLNCSHTFCKYCIDCWKKNKKDCPNCRERITSETRSIVVDNFIDKIVSTLSEEMKLQRRQLVIERAAAVDAVKQAELRAVTAAAVAAAAAAVATSSRSRGGRQNARGRNRGRGARNRGARGASTSAPAPNNPPPVIRLSPPRPAFVAPNSPITVPSDSSSDEFSIGSSEGSSEDDRSPHNDSSFESGDSTAYYGNYGRCYNCGRRGHWANGCPHL